MESPSLVGLAQRVSAMRNMKQEEPGGTSSLLRAKSVKLCGTAASKEIAACPKALRQGWEQHFEAYRRKSGGGS